jgi:hypothetical protein
MNEFKEHERLYYNNVWWLKKSAVESTTIPKSVVREWCKKTEKILCACAMTVENCEQIKAKLKDLMDKVGE